VNATDHDGPADERCDECGALDPANCPCPPAYFEIEDVDDFLRVLADLYDGARANHWAEAEALAESTSNLIGPEARDAVDRDAFLAHLRELFA